MTYRYCCSDVYSYTVTYTVTYTASISAIFSSICVCVVPKTKYFNLAILGSTGTFISWYAKYLYLTQVLVLGPRYGI